MLWSWTNLRNLYWFTNGIIITNTELASIVHAPGINVASTGDSECKLFTHFDISDNWDVTIYPHFCIWFPTACDTTGTLAQLFNTIRKQYFWRILKDGFLNVFSRVFGVFGNILVVSASTPLIHRSVTQDASRVNETTCDLSYSYASHLSALASIEKLD